MRFVLIITFATAVFTGFLPPMSMTATAQEIAGVKCIVDGDRNAEEQFKARHADGEVYFCCKECAATFAADKAKFQTQANHQLVVTQQYTQSACPIAGKAFNTQHTAKVAGVEIAFCCDNCQHQIESAGDLKTKAELIFGTKPFKRAFAKATTDPPHHQTDSIDLSGIKCVVDPSRGANEAFSADHRQGKVYFCCGGCLKAYQDDTKKFSTQANFQLASTGQYVQKTCPVTDVTFDVTDLTTAAKTIKIGGQSIAICCDQCENKLNSVSDKEKRILVFGDKPFKRSFVKRNLQSPQDYSVAPAELADPNQ